MDARGQTGREGALVERRTVWVAIGAAERLLRACKPSGIGPKSSSREGEPRELDSDEKEIGLAGRTNVLLASPIPRGHCRIRAPLTAPSIPLDCGTADFSSTQLPSFLCPEGKWVHLTVVLLRRTRIPPNEGTRGDSPYRGIQRVSKCPGYTAENACGH